MVTFCIVVTPLPYTVKKRLFTFLSESPIIAKVAYGLKIAFMFVFHNASVSPASSSWHPVSDLSVFCSLMRFRECSVWTQRQNYSSKEEALTTYGQNRILQRESFSACPILLTGLTSETIINFQRAKKYLPDWVLPLPFPYSHSHILYHPGLDQHPGRVREIEERSEHLLFTCISLHDNNCRVRRPRKVPAHPSNKNSSKSSKRNWQHLKQSREISVNNVNIY